MQKKQTLNIEKYKELKENAYAFAIILEKDELLKFVRSLEISNREEDIIYSCTLLYPNDLQILDEFNKKLNVNKISEKLNVPVSVLKIKLNEYINYGFESILKNNQSLMNLASQLLDKKSSEEAERIFESKLK